MDKNTTYINLTDADFEREVLQSDQPVLVDFWAPWCAPCVTLGPTIEALAEAYAGRVKVAKVNVEQAPGTARLIGVQSIPLLVFFANGAEVDRMVGLQSERTLRRALDQLLQPAS